MVIADPITAGALVVLAAQKFVESSTGELAKKFTTEAIAKIAKNLDVVLDEDETFAALLQKLAKEINVGKIKQTGLDGVTANQVAAEIKGSVSHLLNQII
jgi:hypothetical protein